MDRTPERSIYAEAQLLRVSTATAHRVSSRKPAIRMLVPTSRASSTIPRTVACPRRCDPFPRSYWPPHAGVPVLCDARPAMAMIIPDRAGLAGADLVWLTPAFLVSGMPEGMARCQNRSLLVIGTQDPHFNEVHLQAARERGTKVIIMPGLDHGLEKPDDAIGSLEAMASIIGRLASWVR